jgi:hypothetical protein
MLLPGPDYVFGVSTYAITLWIVMILLVPFGLRGTWSASVVSLCPVPVPNKEIPSAVGDGFILTFRR